MTQPDYREKARDMAEEARKLYPGNLFDQLDYLLGATRLSFEEAGLAWIACQKLFPQLRDYHKESLRQAHLAGRREGIEASADVLNQELQDLADCDWGDKEDLSVTLRAWLMNARARIRACLEGKEQG